MILSTTLRTLPIFAVATGLSLLSAATVAEAEPPAGVVRTFAFVADPETVVNFLADDSQLVVVSRPSDLEHLQFADDAGDSEESEILDGTIWAYQDAIHVVKGGKAPIGAFFWLIDENTPELPPTGAVARTGPDSAIDQGTFGIKLCGADCGFGDETKFYVPPYGNLDKFVVVTAVFSR